MKFGKLNSIQNVDFTFPATPNLSQQFLDKLKPVVSSPSNVYCGATGWGTKEWLGTYYPKGTAAADYLSEYTKQFNCVELNTTHYRIPSSEQIKDWYDKSSTDFKFCPKLPQMISHSKNLGMSTNRLEHFCTVITGLKEKLGTCFMQLPPYFSPAQFDVLAQFLTEFPTDEISLAVELRHEAWFKSPQYTRAFLDLFFEKDVSPVITDVAGRRDVLHLLLCRPQVFVRFVGNALDTTDYQRIDDWVQCLKSWISQGVQDIYFLLHQPNNILTPEITAYFVHKMNRELSLSLKYPRKYETPQMKLF